MTFYLRNAWFAAREPFTELVNGIAGFLLLPFFIWILVSLWKGFSSATATLTQSEVAAYIGVAEAYFLTFLRTGPIERAQADFSLTLARPRAWPLATFSTFFGRTLGGRLLYLLALFPLAPLAGIGYADALGIAARFLVFLAPLGLLQGLWALPFASAQILWDQVGYFLLPVSKIFLVFGGVFGPLSEYGEPWRSWLVALPGSDLFFQPAYFCVRGEFYRISGLEWSARVALQAAVLLLANAWIYRVARRHHQSWGG